MIAVASEVVLGDQTVSGPGEKTAERSVSPAKPAATAETMQGGPIPIILNPYATPNVAPTAAAEDVNMGDANATAAAAAAARSPPGINGSRALIYQELDSFVDKVLVEPIASFHREIIVRDENLRIKKALGKKHLEHSADAIAETVNAERNVTPTVLRGVVRTEINKINDDHARKVAALEAQITKLKGGKSKKDFGKAGHATKQGTSNKKSRGATAGSGNAASAKKGENKAARSSTKSSGKKQGSKKGKRS
jgi:hypothetical protein